MTDSPETAAAAKRRRLINLGEAIALAALIISALGLWLNWSSGGDKPAVVIEKDRGSIPLALRARVEDDGKRLAISPVEAGHALESLTVSVPGKPAIELGAEPRLSASAIEELVAKDAKDARTGTLGVTIDARYIEAGKEQQGGGRYRLAYRWVDGGLFGGRSLRLTGLTRG